MLKLIGWSFELEDENGNSIKIEGRPCHESYQQWGTSTDVLSKTVPLCNAIISQAQEDGLIQQEV